MSQAESIRSRQIMNSLRAQGWFCFKVHGNETMMAGLPDVVVCAEGLFVGLETKMPDKRHNTSVKQDLKRDEIRAAGGVYEVVCSPAEAVAAVRGALARR